MHACSDLPAPPALRRGLALLHRPVDAAWALLKDKGGARRRTAEAYARLRVALGGGGAADRAAAEVLAQALEAYRQRVPTDWLDARSWRDASW